MLKLVVDDPRRYLEFQRHSYRNFPHLAKQQREVERGFVHTIVENFDCPDGLPNCRDCGGSCIDPTHCKKCGKAHGVAPASKLIEYGVIVVEE